MRDLTPSQRVAASADPGSIEWLDAPRPSPYLRRYGITPQSIAEAARRAIARKSQ